MNHEGNLVIGEQKKTTEELLKVLVLETIDRRPWPAFLSRFQGNHDYEDKVLALARNRRILLLPLTSTRFH